MKGKILFISVLILAFSLSFVSAASSGGIFGGFFDRFYSSGSGANELTGYAVFDLLKPTTATVANCFDSDKGKNLYVRGYVIDRNYDPNTKLWDGCSTGSGVRPVYVNKLPGFVHEYYCEKDGTFKGTQAYCKYGCENDVCLKKSPVTAPTAVEEKATSATPTTTMPAGAGEKVTTSTDILSLFANAKVVYRQLPGTEKYGDADCISTCGINNLKCLFGISSWNINHENFAGTPSPFAMLLSCSDSASISPHHTIMCLCAT